MTIAELAKWAEENDVLDCEVEIQYCDDGGYYYGTRDLDDFHIKIENRQYGTKSCNVVVL